jgi:hypothetical protein
MAPPLVVMVVLENEREYVSDGMQVGIVILLQQELA